jgi:hypothetical protein
MEATYPAPLGRAGATTGRFRARSPSSPGSRVQTAPPAGVRPQPRPVSGRSSRARWPRPFWEAARPPSVSPRSAAATSSPTHARIQPTSGPAAAFPGELADAPFVSRCAPTPSSPRGARPRAGFSSGAPSLGGTPSGAWWRDGSGRGARSPTGTRPGVRRPSGTPRGTRPLDGTGRGPRSPTGTRRSPDSPTGTRPGARSPAASRRGDLPPNGTRCGAGSPSGTRRPPGSPAGAGAGAGAAGVGTGTGLGAGCGASGAAGAGGGRTSSGFR